MSMLFRLQQFDFWVFAEIQQGIDVVAPRHDENYGEGFELIC